MLQKHVFLFSYFRAQIENKFHHKGEKKKHLRGGKPTQEPNAQRRPSKWPASRLLRVTIRPPTTPMVTPNNNIPSNVVPWIHSSKAHHIGSIDRSRWMTHFGSRPIAMGARRSHASAFALSPNTTCHALTLQIISWAHWREGTLSLAVWNMHLCVGCMVRARRRRRGRGGAAFGLCLFLPILLSPPPLRVLC